MRIEKIPAVTLKVASMRNSVRFYKDVLGMEIIFGGEDGSFSSLRAQDDNTAILNLEQGHSVPGWGRMIFYVADVDVFWEAPEGNGTSARESERRVMGRAVFSHARSGRPRVIVRASDLAGASDWSNRGGGSGRIREHSEASESLSVAASPSGPVFGR
jgi:catechol 2,3-dioxygenase-like lactoylglutathione lyase family enzyme